MKWAEIRANEEPVVRTARRRDRWRFIGRLIASPFRLTVFVVRTTLVWFLALIRDQAVLELQKQVRAATHFELPRLRDELRVAEAMNENLSLALARERLRIKLDMEVLTRRLTEGSGDV